MNAKILLSTILISSLGLTLRGQTTTARLTGSVSDASGAAVPEAKITATHVATGTIRTANSGADGRYTIPLLERGGYQVSAQKQGFRPIVRELTLDVGQIARVDFALEVGEMTEKVTVTAQAPLLQTASAERSGVITGSQLDNLLIRSRSINAFLRLLPGVMDESESEVLGTGMNMNIAGNRNNTNNVALDGLMVMSIGSGTNHAALVSQDAVAEVKVLLTNYQAEYGRTSGANIQIVSKSGSREFHGLGSYFLRHEQFNANNFFNNRLGLAKSRYRYRTWTYNIGGPVYIPNKFNRNRDKLFFFWSQEGWPIKAPQGIRQLTVPTELERAGDFSQSLDLNGGLIPVTDPASGLPFPGNRVPAARLDRSGQSLLKFFPAANFFDRNISGGRYNYVFEAIMDNPIRTDTLKVDYHLNPRNILSGSFSFGSIKSTGSLGVSTLISNWPQMEGTFIIPRKILPVRYQRIFSPTLFNELYVGYLWNGARFDTIDERLQRNRRDTVGFAAGQLYSSSNPLKLVPNASFGGVPNAAILSFDGRFPFYDKQNALTLADNITKMAGAHTLKAGYYMDRIWTDRLSGANFNGSFSFGRDVNNPLETGYAYSNAALGVFGSYTEASKRPFNLWRVSNLEWFVQDNWKVTRRLTLDYGMRFAEVLPLIDQDDAMAGFAPQRYTPSRQPRLIAPTLAGGRRVGVHPSTGEIFPATVIGAIAPGTGDPANGMVVTAQDHSYPHALIRNRGIHYGPRFGFAYDLSGNGKTAVRGGFGIFYNRQNSDVLVSPFTTQLPLVDNPVVYYSTIANLGASPGFVFPQSVAGLDPEGHVPTATNFSLSVQREIGFGTVLDAGYVGSLGRHLLWQRNLNAIPFGANFDPANADPTNPRVPLPNTFYRPRIGYSDIAFREWAGSSNYHSLQVTANRRFARGIQFGAAWTWSKTMDFNDVDTQQVSTLIPVRVWNYGLASFDRTHMLKLNWLWEPPKSPWKNPAASLVLNGWQLSGISSFVSGAPLGVGFSTTTAVDITGSPTDGARIVVTGNPMLPKSERTFSRNFRTEVFGLPARGTVGNAAKTLIRGPGINNFDIGIYKNFSVREPMRFQFRWEMYNAFNHTQFSGLDTSARFDPQGNQVNARFGEFTAARSPRLMQFGLRFYF